MPSCSENLPDWIPQAVVLGATGVVGQQLVRQLLAAGLTQIMAIVRRPPADPVSSVHYLLVADFSHLHDALASLPLQNATAYSALGTTRKAAGSQAAFRQVDFGYNFAFARAMHDAGCQRFGLVSAAGANPDSLIFYNRVKGELESALQTLHFIQLVIARPSLLLDSHPGRPGERLLQRGFGLIQSWVSPTLAIRPIEAQRVAAGLLQSLPPITRIDAADSNVVRQTLSSSITPAMSLPPDAAPVRFISNAELLRLTRPGLIEATDPANTAS